MLKSHLELNLLTLADSLYQRENETCSTERLAVLTALELVRRHTDLECEAAEVEARQWRRRRR